MTHTETQPSLDELEQIARRHAGIATLRSQHSDSADFHDVSVWSIEAMMRAAFEAGRQSAS